MILVDSSVWIDHLRRRGAELSALLDAGVVMCHPFVIGELACGNLPARQPLLSELARLPVAPMVSHSEVLAYMERCALMGRGIGWIDVHLLASAAVAGHVPLWSCDKRLAAVAADLGLGYERGPNPR